MQLQNKSNSKCALIHMNNVPKVPPKYNFRKIPANQILFVTGRL